MMLPALALSLCSQADAGPVDMYGFGAASIGRGQGGVAVPDGGQTVFRNPALLQDLAWAEASVGYGAYRARVPDSPDVYWDTNRDGVLDASDEPLSVPSQTPNADGMSVSMARNIGEHVGVALNGFFPADRLMMFGTTEPSLPTWVMFGNRTQRVDLSLGIGAELYKGLSIGGAIEVVAMSRYQISGTIDVGVGAAEPDDEGAGDLVDEIVVDIHEMSLDIVPRAIPIVGFHWDVGQLVSALDGLQFGFAWRAASGIPIDAELDLQLNGTLQNIGDLNDVATTLVVPVELSIFDHYVPGRMSFGGSYRWRDWALGYVDVHRTRWSEMRVNVAQVVSSKIESQMIQVDEDVVDDANQYSAVFIDTTDIHAGIEVYLPRIAPNTEGEGVKPIIRFGGGLIPSPLQSQASDTAFLDSDRFLVTVGGGVVHIDPFGLVPGPVRWDVFYSRQQLAPGVLKISDGGQVRAGLPVGGKPLPIGGTLWSSGAQMSVSF